MLEKPSGDDGGSKKKGGLRLTLVRGGQKNDGYELFTYDIKDGNTRAVTSALLRYKKIPVYFGEYK